MTKFSTKGESVLGIRIGQGVVSPVCGIFVIQAALACSDLHSHLKAIHLVLSQFSEKLAHDIEQLFLLLPPVHLHLLPRRLQLVLPLHHP